MPQPTSSTVTRHATRHLASWFAIAGLLLLGLASPHLRAEDAPAAPAKPAIDTKLLHFEPIVNPVIGTHLKYSAETVKGTAAPTTVYADQVILRVGSFGTRFRESVFKDNWEGIASPVGADAPKPTATSTAMRANEEAVFSDMPQGVPITVLTSVDDTLELAGKTWNTRHITVVGTIAQAGKTYTFEYEYWFTPEVPIGGLLKRISAQTSPVENAQKVTLIYMGHEVPATPGEPEVDLEMAKKLYHAALDFPYSTSAEAKKVLNHEVVQSMIDGGATTLAAEYLNLLLTSDTLLRDHLHARIAEGDYTAALDYLEKNRKFFFLKELISLLEDHEPPFPITDAVMEDIHKRMPEIWKSKVTANQINTPTDTYPGHEVYLWVKLLLEHGRREDAEKVAKDFLVGTSPAMEKLLIGERLAKGDTDATTAYLATIRAQEVEAKDELSAKLFPLIQVTGEIPVDSPLRSELLDEIRTTIATIEDGRERNRYEQRFAVVLSMGTPAEKAEARKIVAAMPTPLTKFVILPLAQNLGMELVAETFDRTYQPSEVFTYWDANFEFLVTLRVMGQDDMYMAMVDELVRRHMVYTAKGSTTQYVNNIVLPLLKELFAHGHQEQAIQALSMVLNLKSNSGAIKEVVDWVAQNGTKDDIEHLKKVSETVFKDHVDQLLGSIATRGDAALGIWLCELAKPDDKNFRSEYNIRLAVAAVEAGDMATATSLIEGVLTDPGTGRFTYADAVAWVILKCGDPKRAMQYFEENFIKLGLRLDSLDGTESFSRGPRGRFAADLMTAAYREGYDISGFENYCLDKKFKNKPLGRNFLAIGLARGHLAK